MKKSHYNKLIRIQAELDVLINQIRGTNFDCELIEGNGTESEQLACASAALECILQELY